MYDTVVRIPSEKVYEQVYDYFFSVKQIGWNCPVPTYSLLREKITPGKEVSICVDGQYLGYCDTDWFVKQGCKPLTAEEFFFNEGVEFALEKTEPEVDLPRRIRLRR
jgi:hypothetical protein